MNLCRNISIIEGKDASQMTKGLKNIKIQL